MDGIIRTILLYSQILGIEGNEEIKILKEITEEKLKNYFKEASYESLQELLTRNTSLENKIGILDGFLELHKKLSLSEEKIKNRIKEEYESELRTDNLKILQEKMISYGKHFLDKGAIEENYLKDIWRNKVQGFMLSCITFEVENNYLRYLVGAEGDITKVPIETFLEEVKKRTFNNLENLNKELNRIYKTEDFSKKETATLWEKAMNRLSIKDECDKEGNIEYTYPGSYGCRYTIPSFKMLYKAEIEMSDQILKEIQNAHKDLEEMVKLSEKPGVSIDTELKGKRTSLNEKKRTIQRMLKSKKIEVIIAANLKYHDSNSSQKYILGVNEDRMVLASDESGYHKDITSKYELYEGILGGGYITVGIKGNRERIENVTVNGISIDYGKEPRDITLEILRKAMPWCDIKIKQ